MKNILQGLDLPPVVRNRTIPLEQKLRAEEEAGIARNVHKLQGGGVGLASAAALMRGSGQAHHLRDHFSAVFWAVVAPINNMAVMEVKTAYDLLRKEPKLYRHGVKLNARTAMERIDKYDAAVLDTMKENLNGDRSQFWLDYSDEHYSSLQHDLEIFYLTVLQVLTRHDIEYREIKARIITSHALLSYAVGMYDTFFRKIEQGYHVALEHMFRDARLCYVLSPWQAVADVLCSSKQPVDVDNDPNVRLAFQVIERHTISLERINGIGDTALGYNPDIKNDVYRNPMNTADRFDSSFSACFGKEVTPVP